MLLPPIFQRRNPSLTQTDDSKRVTPKKQEAASTQVSLQLFSSPLILHFSSSSLSPSLFTLIYISFLVFLKTLTSSSFKVLRPNLNNLNPIQSLLTQTQTPSKLDHVAGNEPIENRASTSLANNKCASWIEPMILNKLRKTWD